MYKVTKGEAPIPMSDIFNLNLNLMTKNKSAGTRQKSHFHNPVRPKKVNSGLQTLRSLGPNIWNLVPNCIKDSSSLSSFKTKIKKWKLSKCQCRLCLTFIQNLGFI